MIVAVEIFFVVASLHNLVGWPQFAPYLSSATDMLQDIILQEDLAWHAAPIALYSIELTANAIVAVEIFFVVASLHKLVGWPQIAPYLSSATDMLQYIIL